MMAPTAVALLSGSLDSLLAARLIQVQGWLIRAIYHDTLCRPQRAQAESAAASLGVPLEVLPPTPEFANLFRDPPHGFGRGSNPCLDCRLYMVRAAAEKMRQSSADLVVTGEVLGQHPMTQKRRDLEHIARASGLEGRLLRPLSAQALLPTLAERAERVDRSKLAGIVGRGRRSQRLLASQLAISLPAQRSSGCRVAEPAVSQRLAAWLAGEFTASGWCGGLLSMGLHHRVSARTMAILGRRLEENRQLEAAFTVA
ncbi:MAG TPA: hypothetical protein VHY20_00415, partial [Pirellulales bacterium]|nr:hypothetical protein [Pirellulales bacterium]